VTVNNNVVNTQTQSQTQTNTQTQANTQTQSNQGQVKGEVESVQGVQGNQGEKGGGGGGREFAQTDTGEESSGSGQSAAGNQPAELASTGVNTGALAFIGALCVVASLLLFRRRRTA
jgi:LPXTG-motif cell wall-anchored protein